MTKDEREKLTVKYASLLYKSGSVQYQISERRRYRQEAKAIKEVLNA